MEKIRIAATEDTPNVFLDKENAVFQISGCAMPEDVNTFFAPIMAWIEDYVKSPNPVTEFAFRLNYFNTATSKILLDLLYKLCEIQQTGNTLKILWYYPETDTDLKEAGEEFSDLVDFPFELLSF